MKFKYTHVNIGYVSPTIIEVKRGSYCALTSVTFEWWKYPGTVVVLTVNNLLRNNLEFKPDTLKSYFLYLNSMTSKYHLNITNI